MIQLPVHDPHHRATDLIKGFIAVAEAQMQGTALSISLLPLELALRELTVAETLNLESCL